MELYTSFIIDIYIWRIFLRSSSACP